MQINITVFGRIPLTSLFLALRIGLLRNPYLASQPVGGAFLTTLHCLRNSDSAATAAFFLFPATLRERKSA